MSDEIKIGDLVAYKHAYNTVTVGLVTSRACLPGEGGATWARWNITWYNWQGEGGTRMNQDREQEVKLFKKNVEDCKL